MSKSWLDVQVDLESSQYQTSRPDEKQLDDDTKNSSDFFMLVATHVQRFLNFFDLSDLNSMVNNVFWY